MKHTQFLHKSLALFLFLGLGYHFAYAQKFFGKAPSQVKVNTVQETPNKAVYTFKAGNQEAKLTLSKKGNLIGIKITNQSCTLGLGKVSVENGALTLDASDLHKGTLGIWVFAAQAISLNGNQAGLTPRQKAANKCRDYCKGKMISQQPVFLAAMGPVATGREDPPVCVPMQAFAAEPFEDAWEDYYACFNACMQKAKDAYQNKK